MQSRTYLVDLRDVVRSLASEVGEPESIWLFGSRAQRTGSRRSDVDLLIVDPGCVLATADLHKWRSSVAGREPLDLFVSRDGLSADSIVNGSRLKDSTNLPALLGAQLLWSRSNGISLEPELPWEQEFLRDVSYQMTIIPTDFTSTLEQMPAELDRMGLPNTLLGTDWASIATKCADILAAAVDTTSRLLPQARGLTRAAAHPRTEYDAQNLFMLALRPWLPDTELSPFEITYAGQKKFADLACVKGQLVIEVKSVTDPSSAASVVKQLAGLSDFYAQRPTTQAIVFAIVVKNGVDWDSYKIDGTHTNFNRRPVVITRSIFLPTPPTSQ